MLRNLWEVLNHDLLLELILLGLEGLHVVEVDSLSLLEEGVHLCVSAHIAEHLQTLGHQLSVQAVVGVELIHVVDVLVGYVAGFDLLQEHPLDEVIDARVEALHSPF